ncbi:hypothetical protein ABL78_2390 [Leptomonas seymouri]|uniref:Rab-GAP TBC domain-containing protein n=1 Tax=Leptomonas seymouri TaxID=5684 RepID=A0A0N1HZA9_LEPSE|nr:hypothetical protein ABL78_2390 [Leptomonas seymouri]|eukprot:KPI88494.1 hypothetical protein ABL78_2390 [Leptomonas seymouri]
MPLSYCNLSRPSRDSSTIQRNAGRVSAAQQQRSSNSSASMTAAVAGAPGSYGGALSYADVAGAAPASSLDTWTGFVSSQWSESVKMASTEGSVAQPSGADLMSSLQTVIARQNRVVEQLQEKLAAQRKQEEEEWIEKKTQAVRSEDQKPSAGQKASRRAPHGEAQGFVENTQVCVFLGNVLEHARLTWAKAVTQHFQSAAAQKPSFTRPSNNGGPSKRVASATAAAAAEISAEAAMEEERVGLPTIDLLFRCLVEGINAEETQAAVTSMGLLPASAWEIGRLGVDQLGLLTVFQRHVQALRAFPALVPTLEVLRECFMELHPSHLTACAPCGPLDSTLEIAEAQLDTFLRIGEETEQVASLLREGLHPSVRRLLYARALQVPLAVTDGKPMFHPQRGFMTNHYEHGLLRYLTCSSRHARDKIARRFQHHYSSPKQEDRARLLQRLTLDDMLTAVGDSDKYFVYTDDVEMVATAMVVDRSLPEAKLRQTLRQLGRPDGVLDHYITFLRFPEDSLILQKAPACGFFPVEGSTIFMAPLCNVTGDTVEQYELASAMMSQLWGRLQGPTPELFQCCLLFESLVQRLALPAVLHATRNLQYPPLVLALRWMLTGFANLLDSFEVLSFWDLVLSYHIREMHRRSPLSSPVGLASAQPQDHTTPCALWLLPMYAASIFVLRAPMVEACRTAAEVDVVFATGHQLRTRSLLQGLLFG